MSTALDSSVIVAALASWHARHDAARLAVGALVRGDEPPIVPAHALVEAFSVFTRLPPGYRISPVAAHALLHAAFHGRARVVSEDGEVVWDLLRDAVDGDVAGGAVYDLRILRAAEAAGAREILTLNPDDFERLASRSATIVTL